MYKGAYGTGVKPVNNRTNLLLGRLNMTTFNVEEEIYVPNDCSRPCFYSNGNNLYLVSSVYCRTTANIIKIDSQLLKNSAVIQQIPIRTDYPWVAIKGDGDALIGGSWSNRVWASSTTLQKYDAHSADNLVASAILGITIPDYSD